MISPLSWHALGEVAWSSTGISCTQDGLSRFDLTPTCTCPIGSQSMLDRVSMCDHHGVAIGTCYYWNRHTRY